MPGVFIRGRHRKLSKKGAAVAAGGMAAAFAAGDALTLAGTANALASDDWSKLRNCESGGNYGTNTGNGYYGAYQFSASTWHGLGYSGLPSNASPATQDEAARRLQARSGWGQWPACSARLGLYGHHASRSTHHSTAVTHHARTTHSQSSASASHGSTPFTGTMLTTRLIGQHREDVRALQAKLAAQGYKLAVDGYYGPQTRGQVLKFQRAAHISVDGVAGPQTFGALF